MAARASFNVLIPQIFIIVIISLNHVVARAIFLAPPARAGSCKHPYGDCFVGKSTLLATTYHAPESSLTFAGISSEVTNASPTRIASMFMFANRSTSAAVKIPLSATTAISGEIIGRRRSVVARETSKVARLRLLMPMSFTSFNFKARSVSASSWTSTRAVNPKLRAQACRSAKCLSSVSAAAMRRMASAPLARAS